MKLAIVQQGPANTGKTSTIRKFYRMLRVTYPEAKVTHRIGQKKDIRRVVVIGDIRIGIESLGDPQQPGKRLDTALRLFVRLDCSVIICAARTRGRTEQMVSRLKDDGYRIKWRRRKPERTAEAQSSRNRSEAKRMLRRVERLLATVSV